MSADLSAVGIRWRHYQMREGKNDRNLTFFISKTEEYNRMKTPRHLFWMFQSVCWSSILRLLRSNPLLYTCQLSIIFNKSWKIQIQTRIRAYVDQTASDAYNFKTAYMIRLLSLESQCGKALNRGLMSIVLAARITVKWSHIPNFQHSHRYPFEALISVAQQCSVRSW